MSIRLIIAKSSFAAAVAAMTLVGAVAAPQVAAAQDQYQSYADCKQDQTNRAIAGGVLGAIGGAVIGSNVAHGSSRDGGALLGGAVGAAGGAAIGHSTKTCDGYDYASGPPPPPPGYYDNGPPPPPPSYDDGYGRDYDQGRYERCTMVESRVYFPDGSTQRDQVRACRGGDGHWYVAQ